MTLLARVVQLLEERGIACALIGAEALAVRGVSRATADRDLPGDGPQALDPALWAGLGEAGVTAKSAGATMTIRSRAWFASQPTANAPWT